METGLTTSGVSLSEMQRVVCLRSPALDFIRPESDLRYTTSDLQYTTSDLQYTTSQFDSLKFQIYFQVLSRWL